MKVLELSGFFRLPDDFYGTVSDAIRLLADYHESDGPSNPTRKCSHEDAPRTRKNAWEEFWKYAVTRNDGKVVMDIGISRFDTDTKKMVFDYTQQGNVKE